MTQTGIDRRTYQRAKGPVLDPAKVEKVLRREGRTVAWLADRCFISPGHLRHLFKGRRPIGPATFQLLLQALNVEAAELASDDEAEAS